MTEFFHMGGYAVFVWSAYGVVALALIGLVVWTLLALSRADAALTDLEALAPRRPRRAPPADAGPEAKEPRHAQP